MLLGFFLFVDFTLSFLSCVFLSFLSRVRRWMCVWPVEGEMVLEKGSEVKLLMLGLF